MTTQQLDSQTADRLWAQYARTQDPGTREALIKQFERLAYSIANRFANRGAEVEDVCQVARLGLVKAVDRFDPATNYRFSTFATPTILGEIRRYFRDNCRMVHVPRGLQELAPRVERAGRELAVRLQRSATPEEIAAELGVPEASVLEALSLEEAGRPLSLEVDGADGGGEQRPLHERLGMDDAGLRRSEYQVSVRQALRQLSEPLQRVIQLRYLSELSQREVAARLGCSQMRVSRLEKRALSELRAAFTLN